MIKIVDVYKTFGTKNVLQGCTLSIARGESMVVIGGSGTGKSVLLKHIIGILRPDSGSIMIGDVNITDLSEDELYGVKKKFGMLFQNAALFDSMNVWENVGFVLSRSGKHTSAEVKEIAIEKLRLVGLTNVENQMPSDLSGGMRKRVGLARAIAYDPEIMLYDEPTTGLDPIMSDAINDLILSTQKKLNVTSVTITHDMMSAYKIADKIAMLYKGKIIAVGTPDEIKNTDNPIVRQFVTGSSVGPIQIEGVTAI